MVHNPPIGAPRIFARLAYKDIDEAICFLEAAFGFSERVDARTTDGSGRVMLTELDVLDSRIMVGHEGAHGIASPKTLGGSTHALIVYVDAIDDHYAQAIANGAEIVSTPSDQFWGDRRYEAKDNEGHLWSFHQHMRDVSAEEMKKALLALRQR